MNVVVVSNRVARAKPDEPLAGGLGGGVAADGAGFRARSGLARAARKPATRRRRTIHSPRSKRSEPARWRPSTCRRSTIAAITKALPIRLCGRRCIRAPDLIHVTDDDYAVVSRDQRVHGARAAAFQFARSGILGSGLSLSDAGRGSAPARHRAAARLLPAHAVGRSPHHVGGAELLRPRRGDARLRSDRLPDRRRPAEFRGLSAHRTQHEHRRRDSGVALGTDPACDLPDRHRRR